MSRPVAAPLTRRRLLGRTLRLAAALPIGALVAACGGDTDAVVEDEARPTTAPPEPTPTATSTPKPFVVAAGEERRLLLAGSPYETPLYVFGSGYAGPVLMVLGGVHGNEPGAWMAAERLVTRLRPTAGALIVVPRANRLATEAFVRTTDELGDLNRLYPGSADGLPMARMALAIFETLREFHVGTLVDMHESWAFFKDRTETQRGTAFLGQTVSSYPAEPGVSLGRDVVEAVNSRVLAAHEAFFFREFPSRRLLQLPLDAPDSYTDDEVERAGRGRRSSLGLPQHLPGLAALLVEMGQQQTLERRIALQVEVIEEVGRRIGLLA